MADRGRRTRALQSGVGHVTLGGVATDVALAKSNVVRYFGTREEIYLELITEACQEWQRAVTKRMGNAAGPDDVTTTLAETQAERPLFCDLLSHVANGLAHNVSLPAARAFRQVALRLSVELGAQVAQAHPDLTESEGSELARAAIYLAGGLYPAARPSPTLVELYRQDPDLAVLCPPFLPTLKRTLAAIAAGLPTLR